MANQQTMMNDEGKKVNCTKNFVVKQKLKFEDNKLCLEEYQLKN